MANNIYLAAPFFSDGQHDRINQVLDALKQNPTIGKIFEPEKHPYTKDKFGSLGWQDAVFKFDTTHIYQADAIVAIADYKKEDNPDNEMDSGTAFELGLAYGCHIPIALVQFDPKKELNLMVSRGITAYFDASKDGLKALAAYDFDVMMPSRPDRPVI